MKLVAQVPSTDGKGLYQVTFQRDVDGLTALCECHAASRGLWCKHRQAVLNDSVEVQEMVRGSELWSVVRQVSDLEAELDAVKTRLGLAKKLLGRVASGDFGEVVLDDGPDVSVAGRMPVADEGVPF